MAPQNTYAAGIRVGPIALNEGVTLINFASFVYAATFTICLLAFVSFLQPYLLTENLGMPFEQQGKAAGTLTFAAEIVVLLLVAPFGALADRIGRRPVYAIGFAWIGIGYFLYPLAETYTQLILFRVISAVGTASIGSMVAIVANDYPQEQSRGKFIGLTGLCNGLGAFIAVFFLSRLPSLFSSWGADALMAGRFSFWVAAAIGIVSALIVIRGLKAGTGTHTQRRESIPVLLAEGGRAALKNPRLATAYMDAFVARSDMVVIGTFFSLWAKEAGLDQGLTLGEAMAKAGMFAGIIQGTVLVWAPVWGFVLDRFDRLTVLCMAMALAAAGYMWVGFSPDPLATAFIPAGILMGMGEGSAVMSGLGLAGQESPARIRGSVLGLFGLCGAIGMLSMGLFGGIVFDAWMPGAPFVVVALLQVIVFCIALFVRLRTGYKAPDDSVSVQG